MRDYGEAAAIFRKAIELNPAVPQNHFQLGAALQAQGLDQEALPAFRDATRLAPDSVEGWLALAQSLSSQNDSEGSKECASRALQLAPNSARAHLILAGVLIEENRTAEAETHIQRAIEIDPRESTAHALLGVRHQSMGRMEEARNSFLRSIELQPSQGFAYCALMRGHRATVEDRAYIDRMEALRSDPSINLRGRSFLAYGLGKAYEDLGMYEAAMAAFDEANRLTIQLKFGSGKPDAAALKETVDRTIRTFDRGRMPRNASSSDSEKPIFIVGMMRSGTTLVEQIVSSHPQVAPAGEQPFWMTRAHEAIETGSARSSGDRLRSLAEEYLTSIETLAPGAERVTDKMPDNYLVLGLIHLAFPRAKLIHIRRNPADTAISIYTTPNPARIRWTHDKASLVSAYREYERLMEHWATVIPSDRLLTVQYEELVSDRESLTRQLIDFCGLPWDDACLRPEDNDRSVITPSVWQVRQPVYTSSVGRWRRYEPYLGPLRALAKGTSATSSKMPDNP